MRIDVACFTERGQALGERLRQALPAASLTRCGEGGTSVREWTAARFAEADALVFVGAVGIAVRAIAPLLVSKAKDPAVVAVDDAGRFAVALLSGHIGGANALADRVAGILDAVPVVTTATDAAGVFAIDAWAARRGMAIRNPERIKRISGMLLAGKAVRVRTPFAVKGSLPPGMEKADSDCDVVIDVREDACPDALRVIPPVAVLGVGCRRGVSAEAMDRAFTAFCAAHSLCVEAVGLVCSIDRKRNEPGLVTFCERRGLPFRTFGQPELARVDGDFTASAFVEAVTGVDTVCERSAVLGSGGRLMIGKTIVDGIAMALAAGDVALDFDGGPP